MSDERYDFQKFDFHAKRFYFSESARQMTAEEVGQYLLLLVEAWMGSKDATLPDNPRLLAMYARVPQVSENVLAMFPIVETSYGPRRQNETLYAEWQAAVARSEGGKAKAEARWGTSKTAAVPVLCNSNASAMPESVSVSVSETGSGAGSGPGTETKPSNSNHALLFSSNGANAPYPEKSKEVQPDYLQFRRTWHGRVRASGKLGKSAFFADKYLLACTTYGVSKVEAAFLTWSESQRDWKWAEDHKHAFFSFLKKLPEYVEEDDEILPTPAVVADDEEIPAATPEQLAGADASIAACIDAEKKSREERIKKFGRGGPVNEGSPLDYLAEVTRGQ